MLVVGRVQVLGCGAELPRCLRAAVPWVRKIQLNEEVFLQTVADIWDSKPAFDAQRPMRSALPVCRTRPLRAPSRHSRNGGQVLI